MSTATLKRALALMAAALLLQGLWLLPARAADAASTVTTLESIDVSTGAGRQVIVRLHLSAPLANPPKDFTIREPARVAIDLPGTALDVDKRYRKFDVGMLRAYAAVAAGGRTRVVLDLSRMVAYTVGVQGNDVLVTLGQSAAAPTATVGSSTQDGGTATAAPVAVRHRIQRVDFRRGEEGSGRVIVDLSDSHTQVNVQKEGGKIVAHFSNTTAPASLLKRLDVLDFATPVKYIDTRRSGAGVDIIVTPVKSGNFQQVSFQTDDRFTLELEPLTQQEREKRQREHPRYTGKKITLDFQKVDVRSLLQIIADVAKVNMVVSDSVKGQIAIRLNDVPWDQALAIILRSKGLGQRQQGNVIFVAPLKELAARRKLELESQQQTTKLAPLHSELMQVNYAKASDIAQILKSGDNSILGSRGRVTVDPRTNTLLVLDTLAKLGDIRQLIERLDVPVRQVQIESRIVIANNNFDRQIGTRFGVTALHKLGSNGLITTSGNGSAASGMVGSYLANGRSLPISPP
ncbi:MAG: secretin and TonB N-terminal domain-containing protein, partial [Sinobacteraceae bacterium]|nr:secretin and TonB N-terminal domain-containing protein [Nevskiaceae bacterium]